MVIKMTNIDYFEKEYKKHLIKYYRQIAENKDINSSIQNAFKKAVIKLTVNYTHFCILKDCMKILINNNSDFNKLSQEKQTELTNLLYHINDICFNQEQILYPISEIFTSNKKVTDFK